MRLVKDFKMNKRALLILSILAAGVLSITYYMTNSVSSESNGRAAVSVEYLTVKKDKLIEKLEALGSTEAMKSITITAGISEKLSSIEAEEGQFVRKGDLIVTLSKEQEEAEKQAVGFEVKEHLREVNRLKQLVSKNAAPQSRLDARRTELLKAQANQKQIEAKINDRELKAPFDGILGLMNISIGALVKPGDAITTLDAIDPMRIDMVVPARYLSSIKEDLPIVAHSSIFSESFQGKLTNIDSRIDARTRSIRLRGQIPNPDLRLKPGMLLNVFISSQEREAITLPEISVFSRGETHFVYVIKSDDTIEEMPVKIGYRSPGLVEITEGLTVGQKVVVEGIVKLRPGIKVESRPFQSGEKSSQKPNQAT